MVDEGALSAEDLNLFKYVDDVQDAWGVIRDFYQL
jgi:hypothetical protein